jgi:hypothetical protein
MPSVIRRHFLRLRLFRLLSSYVSFAEISLLTLTCLFPQVRSFDCLSYRAIQANLKARGLGAKGKREELVERLSTAVEKSLGEKWKKVVRDAATQDNDTDDSLCETNHKDCKDGYGSDSSSSAGGFEPPDEESDNASKETAGHEFPEVPGIDATATPSKAASGGITNDTPSTPTTPSMRLPLKSPSARRVVQFIRNCTPAGLQRQKERVLLPMEEEKENQVSSVVCNIELQSPFKPKDTSTTGRASTGRKGKGRKKRRDDVDAGRRKLAF